jgi:hypothetical protein
MSSSDGKIAGTFLGGLLGGPWGALIGGVVGALFDQSSTPNSLPPPQIPPQSTGGRRSGGQTNRAQSRPHQPPHTPSELDRCLQVMGLDPGVTLATAKQRYRVLARELHPDVLQSQGLNAQSLLRAQETFKQVSAAYQSLTRLMR